MKKARFILGILITAILTTAILAFAACGNDTDPQSGKVKGVSLPDTRVTINLFNQIIPKFEPANATNKEGTWSSDKKDVVRVEQDGTVYTEENADPDDPTKNSAVITFITDDGGSIATCTVTVTNEALSITELPPLKETFKDYFMMGNIFDPYSERANPATGIVTVSGDVTKEPPYKITKPYLTHHYNALTHQNIMKPQDMCGRQNPTPGVYDETNIASARGMIDAAYAAGIKIQGHCLLWHQQIPTWQQNLRTSSESREAILGYLREYITDIVTKFKDKKIYAWDVLNEAFPDGIQATANWRDSIRQVGDSQSSNPWYVAGNKALGADFVYEGFLAARNADPSVILYYNDYNLDSVGKRTMVYNMVRDVNNRYKEEHPEANGRLLIEGIGMQSHHNGGVTPKAISDSLDKFRELDDNIRISISELDLLAQNSYDDYNSNVPVTDAMLLKQADLYGEYFKVFLKNSDIIERVSFWGVSDGTSWRRNGQPLIFDRDYKAKLAYYKILEALKDYEENN